ncbi:MAG: SDR family NAD(P)-dependent oxidoreductase [Actinomycetia bacterium]|nr:SDR family NAD(P)-dependent oxidoreductase [Actinomycetes bacterium]MCP5035568.1 SDR family NAD(P)-dependent oxidoreductase [Actinomycetes bacterium]
MDSLTGKTAVVTGGGSGIGRGMALRFARAGMNVVVADIDEQSMATVVDEVEAMGVKGLAVATDVADPAANQALADATVTAFGQANVICLNAGVTGSIGQSWTLTEEDWDWSLGILLNGVINGIRSFVPGLVDHGDGHVVITSSIVGHVSAPFSAPYAVAKHGVAALAESLHHELRIDRSTVGVTCLCPGFVNTNIITAARARPDDSPGSALDDHAERWLDISEPGISSGIDPEIVGDLVHDAVLANQFWLFTDHAWDDSVERRTQEIINRLPPTMGRPSLS